jgi:hypothetical protein
MDAASTQDVAVTSGSGWDKAQPRQASDEKNSSMEGFVQTLEAVL